MADKPETLAAALAALQTRLPQVHKGETARVKSDKGNYSYQYADLADVTRAVMPLLGELGLSFTARPTLTDTGGFILAYELRHTSGDSIGGQYPLPTGGTPQALGSAITYGRRYCLCAVTGVAPDSDDDDAAAAQASAPKRQAHVVSSEVEPETDPAWLAITEDLITAATTRPELDAIVRDIKGRVNAGKVSGVHRNHLRHLVTQRGNELAGTAAADAEDDAARDEAAAEASS